MTQEMIAIIGVGVALGGLNLYLARGLNEVRRDMSALRERMARVEGAVDLLSKFLIDRERASAERKSS